MNPVIYHIYADIIM